MTEHTQLKAPSLVLVPTPIGNLEDITLRALTVLKQCDCILAEDTRTTGMLLRHFGISKKIYSHHAHNEHQQLQNTIDLIKSNSITVLVSDAGTPGVSDPGFLLVRECFKQGIIIETLPGPTALIPALINSGLPCDRFCFEGFLPHKKGRQTRLNNLKTESRTMIFYESPFRLLKTLEQFVEVFGPQRHCCVSRELTKVFEENQRGTLAEVLKYYKLKTIKGEIVIVVQGYTC